VAEEASRRSQLLIHAAAQAQHPGDYILGRFASSAWVVRSRLTAIGWATRLSSWKQSDAALAVDPELVEPFGAALNTDDAIAELRLDVLRAIESELLRGIFAQSSES
jgi:hypothetical protein